ncbi:MAG: glycosyltransferase [Deltaproteobacteria bacterium]|nr:glycosyltransferase [Deltaproteobacteria bacterium]
MEQRLRSLARPTVEVLGAVSRQGVIAHIKSARGFVFPGAEDFGITPLESLAAGTRLISFRSGGVLATLAEADTEFFIEQCRRQGALRLRAAVEFVLRPSLALHWNDMCILLRQRLPKKG